MNVCRSAGWAAVLLLCGSMMAIASSASALTLADATDQPPAKASEKLEALITVYTNVYYALGACDGFVTPQQEAPFDPYGPALAKWPESFKRQMGETRAEGKIDGARLARQHRFTIEERAELCKRQLDSANADLAQVLAHYGEER